MRDKQNQQTLQDMKLQVRSENDRLEESDHKNMDGNPCALKSYCLDIHPAANRMQWVGTYVDGDYLLVPLHQFDKLKFLEAEIEKEKERLGNMDDQSDHSFLSFQGNGDPMETVNICRTEFNDSRFEEQFEKVKEQLENQEDKYRQNILKLQKTRAEMKKNLQKPVQVQASPAAEGEKQTEMVVNRAQKSQHSQLKKSRKSKEVSVVDKNKSQVEEKLVQVTVPVKKESTEVLMKEPSQKIVNQPPNRSQVPMENNQKSQKILSTVNLLPMAQKSIKAESYKPVSVREASQFLNALNPKSDCSKVKQASHNSHIEAGIEGSLSKPQSQKWRQQQSSHNSHIKIVQKRSSKSKVGSRHTDQQPSLTGIKESEQKMEVNVGFESEMRKDELQKEPSVKETANEKAPSIKSIANEKEPSIKVVLHEKEPSIKSIANEKEPSIKVVIHEKTPSIKVVIHQAPSISAKESHKSTVSNIPPQRELSKKSRDGLLDLSQEENNCPQAIKSSEKELLNIQKSQKSRVSVHQAKLQIEDIASMDFKCHASHVSQGKRTERLEQLQPIVPEKSEKSSVRNRSVKGVEVVQKVASQCSSLRMEPSARESIVKEKASQHSQRKQQAEELQTPLIVDKERSYRSRLSKVSHHSKKQSTEKDKNTQQAAAQALLEKELAGRAQVAARQVAARQVARELAQKKARELAQKKARELASKEQAALQERRLAHEQELVQRELAAKDQALRNRVDPPVSHHTIPSIVSASPDIMPIRAPSKYSSKVSQRNQSYHSRVSEAFPAVRTEKSQSNYEKELPKQVLLPISKIDRSVQWSSEKSSKKSEHVSEIKIKREPSHFSGLTSQEDQGVQARIDSRIDSRIESRIESQIEERAPSQTSSLSQAVSESQKQAISHKAADPIKVINESSMKRRKEAELESMKNFSMRSRQKSGNKSRSFVIHKKSVNGRQVEESKLVQIPELSRLYEQIGLLQEKLTKIESTQEQMYRFELENQSKLHQTSSIKQESPTKHLPKLNIETSIYQINTLEEHIRLKREQEDMAEKQNLREEIGRLKKYIREMQLEKLRSIDVNKNEKDGEDKGGELSVSSFEEMDGTSKMEVGKIVKNSPMKRNESNGESVLKNAIMEEHPSKFSQRIHNELRRGDWIQKIESNSKGFHQFMETSRVDEDKIERSFNPQKISYSRMVEEMKRVNPEEDQAIPSIIVKDLQIPKFIRVPLIQNTQEELVVLAKETYRLFGIDVEREDESLCMKKYKNCVIFSLECRPAECILWHYSGKFYIGGWKHNDPGEGEKTGQGLEYIPDKHIYKGQFLNGKKNGTGFLKMANGTIYDGQWIDGVKDGRGIYFDSSSNTTYSGEWKEGKKEGFGLLRLSQNQYYQGTFVKSVKEGFGFQKFANGDKYKGEYKNNKFEGKGKYQWTNGAFYEGEFHNGMRHGQGSWKSAPQGGDIYSGAYENDRKHGYGRYVWAKGCIYEGEFMNDVKNGQGRLIDQRGKEVKGVWQDGNIVSTEEIQTNQDSPLRKFRRANLS